MIELNEIKWNFCDEKMPDRNNERYETLYLVICREWDIFSGAWGGDEIRLMPYINKSGEWNTKSAIQVIAWVDLSPLLEQYKKQLTSYVRDILQNEGIGL